MAFCGRRESELSYIGGTRTGGACVIIIKVSAKTYWPPL
jgi:hypothetical protein